MYYYSDWFYWLIRFPLQQDKKRSPMFCSFDGTSLIIQESDLVMSKCQLYIIKKHFYSLVTLRAIKLECFSMLTIFSLVWYLLIWPGTYLRGEHLKSEQVRCPPTLLANVRQGKVFCGANAVSSLYVASERQKSFIALISGINDIKLFFSVIETEKEIIAFVSF